MYCVLRYECVKSTANGCENCFSSMWSFQPIPAVFDPQKRANRLYAFWHEFIHPIRGTQITNPLLRQCSLNSSRSRHFQFQYFQTEKKTSVLSSDNSGKTWLFCAFLLFLLETTLAVNGAIFKNSNCIDWWRSELFIWVPLGWLADPFREVQGRCARFPGLKQLQLSEQNKSN